MTPERDGGTSGSSSVLNVGEGTHLDDMTREKAGCGTRGNPSAIGEREQLDDETHRNDDVSNWGSPSIMGEGTQLEDVTRKNSLLVIPDTMEGGYAVLRHNELRNGEL